MNADNSFRRNDNKNANSAADPVKLLKTVSTPSALNVAGSSITPKPSTPTLAQLSQQPLSSFNFRHSLLYDSGAESCDADDQQHLIRTPSARSHKFIIIPSTPLPSAMVSSGSAQGPHFRQTVSTNSLGTVAAAAALSRSAQRTLPMKQQHSADYQRHDNFPTPNITVSPSLCAQTDAIHQTVASATTSAAAAVAAMAATSVSASASTAPCVKFTLYDSETSGAGALSITDPIAASTNGSPSTTTAAVSNVAPIIRTTITTPATAPIVGSGFRPRYDRINSSMRSVVSAYVPSTYDVNNATITSLQSNAPHQLLHPNIYGNNELSASSYIYRDHVANQIYSDVTSVRSLASIGIGSTDGHKLVIRRVPHTPDELFSLVHPPSPPPPGFDDDDEDSFMDMSDETANLKPRQQHWANKMQFVLACIGYSVGLGNVWRFPYMCYKSGGGVFLVPYCIILIVCSIPLLFMELSIGQYTGRGPIGALGQLCPLFKGAGLASVVVSFLMSTYYSVIIGYSIYYFFTSFKTDMPWIDCSNRWNTPDCWVPQRKNLNMTAPGTSRTPSEEFFENKMLQISPGIEYPGLMRWELFACLICAWLMVYFATWKSIKSSAKVRYFTATFPFVLIIILMGRAVTLEGADEGLRYFFRPNWTELKNANVWINAASQNFNSLGITFGSMISFASYNKYNNNIVRDTISVGVVNIMTSLLVGVFAFATLGNLALEQNTNVKDVIGDGPGLIFVVYPQAMAKMPYAQLWAVMFFFMLLCLGLNSQFAIVEVVVTSIQDGYPNWIKRNLGYHEIVVLIVCIISFLFGLPNLIQGGIYYFQLMDHYAASVTIVFLAFCQMIAIAWFYGTGRLSKNIKQMTGRAPSLYLKSCWVIFGPCLLFAIWVLSLINYHEPTYHNGRYKYPEWAYGIGWMFASLSLVCIPGYALINVWRSTGSTFWERVQNTLRPNIYECKICGEHHCEHDYPEQEQYMLAQEMTGMYKPSADSKYKVPMSLNLGIPTTAGNKMGYNPLFLQQQHQHQLQQQHQHKTDDQHPLQQQPQSDTPYADSTEETTQKVHKDQEATAPSS